jgi:hypothetical protein
MKVLDCTLIGLKLSSFLEMYTVGGKSQHNRRIFFTAGDTMCAKSTGEAVKMGREKDQWGSKRRIARMPNLTGLSKR